MGSSENPIFVSLRTALSSKSAELQAHIKPYKSKVIISISLATTNFENVRYSQFNKFNDDFKPLDTSKIKINLNKHYRIQACIQVLTHLDFGITVISALIKLYNTSSSKLIVQTKMGYLYFYAKLSTMASNASDNLFLSLRFADLTN